jgi:hypothetical protein
MTISNNVHTSYIQSTNNSSNTKKVSDTQVDSSEEYEFKNIPKDKLNTIYDDTNTFGMFLNKNDKAMKLLDEQLGNMDESERSKFLFVMGHVGDEHVLRVAFQRGISPAEAIPYVTDVAQTFKNDTVFAESLYKMVDNKEETSSDIGKLVEKFYEKYTNTFDPIDLKA